MELIFKEPISLQFSVVDVEEAPLPSFKLKVTFEIPHPTGKLMYSADDLWFECAVWDVFITKLADIVQALGQREVSLSDMSGGFILSLIMSENCRNCTFMIQTKEPDLGMGCLCTRYEVAISIDDVGLLREKFLDFPVWWR